MNIKKLIFTFIALALMSEGVLAQVGIDIKAGANIGAFSGLSLPNIKIRPGFQAQVGAYVPLNDKGIFLNPALRIVSRNAKASYSSIVGGFATSSNHQTIKLSSLNLELPIMLGYRFGLGETKNGISLLTGPVIGYGIGGSRKAETSSETGSLDFYGDKKNSVTDSRFDMGWGIAVTGDFSRVLVSFETNWGFINHEYFGDKNNKFTNSAYMLSVGYRLFVN